MTKPRRLDYDYSEGFAKPIYATGLVEQPWDSYTETDHEVWRTLFKRQEEILNHRAASLYLKGRDELGLDPFQIPKFEEINQKLKKASGWELVGVEGLLPGNAFFNLLIERKFPVTWWIRTPNQMDYLSEPDLFHDLYGHVPMLMDKTFADFVCLYGQAAKRVAGQKKLEEELTRLYWFTVEFGLMGNLEKPLISGAGILSSKTESEYATDSKEPRRLPFDLNVVTQKTYRIDIFQDTYFVIEDFDQWYKKVKPFLETIGT